MKRRSIFLLCSLVGLLFLMVGCGGSTDPVPNIQVEDWTNTTLNQYIGKKVFMVFWGTSCNPCIKEMPTIQQIYDKNLTDVVILAVGTGNLDTMKKFANQYKFKFYNDTNKLAFKNYTITGTPTNIFLGKDGKEVQRKVGSDSVDNFVNILNKIP